jgi:hypothetical protein
MNPHLVVDVVKGCAVGLVSFAATACAITPLLVGLPLVAYYLGSSREGVFVAAAIGEALSMIVLVPALVLACVSVINRFNTFRTSFLFCVLALTSFSIPTILQS